MKLVRFGWWSKYEHEKQHKARFFLEPVSGVSTGAAPYTHVQHTRLQMGIRMEHLVSFNSVLSGKSLGTCSVGALGSSHSFLHLLALGVLQFLTLAEQRYGRFQAGQRGRGGREERGGRRDEGGRAGGWEGGRAKGGEKEKKEGGEISQSV